MKNVIWKKNMTKILSYCENTATNYTRPPYKHTHTQTYTNTPTIIRTSKDCVLDNKSAGSVELHTFCTKKKRPMED